MRNKFLNFLRSRWLQRLLQRLRSWLVLRGAHHFLLSVRICVIVARSMWCSARADTFFVCLITGTADDSAQMTRRPRCFANITYALVAATQGSDGPSASGNTHDECAPLSPSSMHHGVWSASNGAGWTGSSWIADVLVCVSCRMLLPLPEIASSIGGAAF